MKYLYNIGMLTISAIAGYLFIKDIYYGIATLVAVVFIHLGRYKELKIINTGLKELKDLLNKHV